MRQNFPHHSPANASSTNSVHHVNYYKTQPNNRDVGAWQFSQSLVAVSGTSTAKDVFTIGNRIFIT